MNVNATTNRISGLSDTITKHFHKRKEEFTHLHPYAIVSLKPKEYLGRDKGEIRDILTDVNILLNFISSFLTFPLLPKDGKAYGNQRWKLDVLFHLLFYVDSG